MRDSQSLFEAPEKAPTFAERLRNGSVQVSTCLQRGDCHFRLRIPNAHVTTVAVPSEPDESAASVADAVTVPVIVLSATMPSVSANTVKFFTV